MSVEVINGMADTIAKLEQKLAEREWIPVSEELPKRNEVVLVTQITTNNIRCVHLCKYFDDDSENPWWSYIGDGCMWNDEILAWMPLPEPYKESEER